MESGVTFRPILLLLCNKAWHCMDACRDGLAAEASFGPILDISSMDSDSNSRGNDLYIYVWFLAA